METDNIQKINVLTDMLTLIDDDPDFIADIHSRIVQHFKNQALKSRKYASAYYSLMTTCMMIILRNKSIKLTEVDESIFEHVFGKIFETLAGECNTVKSFIERFELDIKEIKE